MTPREGVEVVLDRADVLKALRDTLNVTDNRVTQAFGKPWLDDAASRIMAIQPVAHPAATAREEAIRAEVIEECAKVCEDVARRFNDDGYADRQAGRSDSNSCQRWAGAVGCRDAIRALALARSTGGNNG